MDLSSPQSNFSDRDVVNGLADADDAWKARYADKIKNAQQAVLVIKPGQRVFVGTACATPRALVAALEDLPNPPPDVELVHFITTNAIPHDEGGKARTRYRHRTFFVSSDIRAAVMQGAADYVPIQISLVPELMARGSLPINVAMIQVSPPDAFGYVSLGVSVDISDPPVRKIDAARRLKAGRHRNPLAVTRCSFAGSRAVVW
jgi:acyl-CoA hydrolase